MNALQMINTVYRTISLYWDIFEGIQKSKFNMTTFPVESHTDILRMFNLVLQALV